MDIRKWYNVNAKSQMVKEAFVLSVLLGFVLTLLMGYLFIPSAHALRQPVIPKGAIEIKTCASTISAGDGIAETNYVSGDAACKYECYYQGDFCVRCSHACINHPALVLNVWYWYDLCYVPLGNGLVVSVSMLVVARFWNTVTRCAQSRVGGGSIAIRCQNN